jgi:putative transcriptional regulator|nr:helix-turn-helix transcriptional regulator [Pseudalkalibacillus hwajinpoensis]
MVKNVRLKMARVEHDLSQQELAKKVGVSRQTIGLIELGKYNPSLQLCLSICWALNKSLDELFWMDPE